MRQFNRFESVVVDLDRALTTLFSPVHLKRAMPVSEQAASSALNADEVKRSAALMRVNHVGEVCAQALYYGQARLTQPGAVRDFLLESATEEADHLAWCSLRLQALQGRVSFLNPIWYAGSYALGCAAGLAGTAWGLGFVTETERQVEAHLSSHLTALPVHDVASKAVVQQMMEDECHHADVALSLGAKRLPSFVKFGMRLMAKIMTTTAYYF